MRILEFFKIKWNLSQVDRGLEISLNFDILIFQFSSNLILKNRIISRNRNFNSINLIENINTQS